MRLGNEVESGGAPVEAANSTVRNHSTCILSFQGGTVDGQVYNVEQRESFYRGRKRLKR